ncbi:hypothetical protein [Erythrobacter sp. JK5]|uniref:hypothetical protein n=1 Tax=Erythrobacter sp. JK5 TaxID=2829500 RepID=UPI001BA59D8E|nr:hypothetical protein [Erythrobacter sp. JK5]QUL36876.1 hypothetical protein KDC96_10695 [Erythrobacter sp. JK5]
MDAAQCIPDRVQDMGAAERWAGTYCLSRTTADTLPIGGRLLVCGALFFDFSCRSSEVLCRQSFMQVSLFS